MPSSVSSLPVTKPRVVSLDFLRGLTVAGMILVNNPGDWGHIYPPLEHSKWDGCTPTDLVFPFFLFIVGVSITLSLGSKKNDPEFRRKAVLNIIRRSLSILALALFLNLIPEFDFAHLRIMGVLTRIAIVYCVCSLVYLNTDYKSQAWIAGSLLIGYYLVMTLIPVPGVGSANLTPEGNLGAWIDRSILTENHLWKSAKTWDPEGLLGTLPAFATGFLGILTGTWLQRKEEEGAVKAVWMFVAGVLAVIAGLVWNLFFPINKALWTSSFVLFAGGLACIGLALSYWLIDIQGRKKGIDAFLAFGSNAITAYFISGILFRIDSWIPVWYHGIKTSPFGWLNQACLVPNFSPVNASLIYAIVYVLVNLIPVWIMYKRKIFFKL